nr:unnamed protein product [Callosobruchus analis]
MRINTGKSKVMGITNRKVLSNTVNLNGIVSEQVYQFKYLGCTPDYKGRDEFEINERIKSAVNLYRALSSFISKREVSRDTKIKVYRSVFLPVTLWGSETWTLTNQLKSRIQAIEMKYLGKAKGVTKMDRIRNEAIREQLGVEPVLKHIKQSQLRWFGHVNRLH